MLDFLFSYGGYTPHGFCLAWDLRVLWTHIGADVLIALSYFSIPAIILVFLRKRKDPELTKPALLFTSFILLCGITHLMAIVTLYLPLYGLQGALKMATGLVSAYTAYVLWRLLPVALTIQGRGELMSALEDRDHEIAERGKAEAAALATEAALARKVDELQAANNELSEFAYAASHDLKSPVNTLSALLDDLQLSHAALLPEDARDELSEARELTTRMGNLVTDILTYSRLLNGEYPMSEVDLSDIFAAAVADFKAEIDAAHASVTIGPLPMISGNAHYLGVLARNLLSNALTFRDPTRRPVITISALTDGAGYAGFSISDNGIGIAEEHRDRIFRMFSRLHSSDDYPGTGLGLTLCRRAVAAHGGDLLVESVVGEGTTFHVRLEREVNDDTVAA